MFKSNIRFSIYAWTLLGYNLLVIIWGAFVRATGSGAGCGAHWPLCNGEIIPQARAIETMVEFGHRITSGLALPLVIVLFVWAWRSYPGGHFVRKASAWAVALTITEALVGAGLVLFQMVAKNDSLTRALWMIGHLLNTFLLLAALSLTAYWSTTGAPGRVSFHSPIGWGLTVGVVVMLLLGSSGAVTALGDTLYPTSSLAEGVQQDFAESAHLFIRLRVYHPLLAVLVGAFLTGLGIWVRARFNEPSLARFSHILVGLFLLQLMLGVINVVLLAPVWMQLIHLLAADLVWITLILMTAAVFAFPEPTSRNLQQHVYDGISKTTT